MSTAYYKHAYIYILHCIICYTCTIFWDVKKYSMILHDGFTFRMAVWNNVSYICVSFMTHDIQLRKRSNTCSNNGWRSIQKIIFLFRTYGNAKGIFETIGWRGCSSILRTNFIVTYRKFTLAKARTFRFRLIERWFYLTWLLFILKYQKLIFYIYIYIST